MFCLFWFDGGKEPTKAKVAQAHKSHDMAMERALWASVRCPLLCQSFQGMSHLHQKLVYVPQKFI